MSYPNYDQFPGAQGHEDGSAPGATGGPTQPQIGQPIESTAGQFQGGTMGVPSAAAGPQQTADGAKTTLWYDLPFSTASTMKNH